MEFLAYISLSIFVSIVTIFHDQPWMFSYHLNIGPLSLFLGKHPHYYVSAFLTNPREFHMRHVNRLVHNITYGDFFVLSDEWKAAPQNSVDQYSYRPNVCLAIVQIFLHDFRGAIG